MNKNTPALSDKEARNLATRIVKESSDVSVKIGQTNGRNCLHVKANGNGGDEPTDGVGSRTIYTPGEWETHPSNRRMSRNKQMAEQQPTEALMVSNKGADA